MSEGALAEIEASTLLGIRSSTGPESYQDLVARTQFDPQTFLSICRLIDRGTSLKKALQTLRGENVAVPCFDRFYLWLKTFPEAEERYARAKENSADSFADEIVEIADGATPQTVNVARLQVDARKWAAAKLKPKTYGDRVEQHLTGSLSLAALLEATSSPAALPKPQEALEHDPGD
jgi:hypothetical protein